LKTANAVEIEQLKAYMTNLEAHYSTLAYKVKTMQHIIEVLRRRLRESDDAHDELDDFILIDDVYQ